MNSTTPRRSGAPFGVHSAAATTPLSRGGAHAARRRTRIGAGATAVVLAAGIVPFLATSSNAAVPTFPDNVVVFPDRDFVTVEGYQDHIGQDATITVTRGGQVVGSAVGTVAKGDVAFEINHPGGYCWGAGGGPAVTPDIVKGDKVTIKFADGTTGDTTVSTGTATQHATLSGSTVTVTGTYGADVIPGQVEARIVNPDLTAEIGRRDVRAVAGGLARAPKGGYSSSLELADGKFTATYVFDTARAAEIAAATQVERFMSWQVEDTDANRQGLTISEFGESGGPGLGGCPAGPADVAAPKATYATTRSADKTKLAVKWTPADPVPGAAAVTGYSVEALKADGTLSGARTAATANGVTLTVDAAVADYTVEVRALTGAKMGDPFTLAPTSGTGQPPADQTAPKLTATPAAGATKDAPAITSSVTLASETAADVYFTTDGKPVVDGDLPSDTAQLYKAPIAITAPTEVHAVAIDRAGNISTQVVGFYAATAPTTTPPVPPTDPANPPTDTTGNPPAPADPPAQAKAPAAPVLTQPTAVDTGKTSVKLTWAKVDTATGYQVTAYNDATPPVALPAAQQPGETTDLTQTVAGLTGSTAYRFSVVAINAGGRSGASNEVRVVTLEDLTIGTAKWKSGDFRVTGTSTAPSGTVTVFRTKDDGTIGAQIGTLQATLTTAVAPATGTTYSWRVRTGVPTTNPGRVFVKSSTGGVAGPFVVTNG